MKASNLNRLSYKLTLLCISGIILWGFVNCKSGTIHKTQDSNANVARSGIDTAFIHHLFRNYKVPNPGASFMVIKNGEVVNKGGYGYANVEQKTKATPATNYRLASVSKQFTAMVIMMLIEEKKLSFETTLTEIYPEFPAYGGSINIRHLLTHRSGLVDYGRFIKEGQVLQLTDQEVFEGLLGTDSTNFSPGSDFQYSNTGYVLLALIAEKISGKSFSEFLEKEIFEPLGMTHSVQYHPQKEIANRAYGYVKQEGRVVRRDQSLTSALQGDGCIYSSVIDYFQWDQALYTDNLIPKETLADAFVAWDKNGKTDSSGYGYGWVVDYSNDVKILEHTGGTMGFVLHVVRVPSLSLSAAVFTNRSFVTEEFTSIAHALVSMYSDGKLPMPEIWKDWD